MLGGLFRKKKETFDLNRLTLRIIADVDDVDPGDTWSGSVALPDTPSVPIALVKDEFLPRVFVQLCVDRDDGCLQWLTESNSASSNRSREELFRVALKNIDRKSEKAELRKVNAKGGVAYTPVCEGMTLSSFIFSNELLKKSGLAKAEIVAVIPNRDTFYFCDRSSPENVSLLNAIADLAWDDEDCPRKYRITKDLLVANDKAQYGWARYGGQA